MTSSSTSRATRCGPSAARRTWGLEYLFGIVEVDTGEPVFRTFWAHDRDEERQALLDFVAWLDARRRQWPDLHVYHYAPYETAALLRLAARHGVCEDEVDQLLRDGVFVDLYAVVRSAIRVSQRSYSIKKLEPLYMAGSRGGRHQRRRLDRRLPPVHGGPRRRAARRGRAAARRDRRLQPRRLRLDVAAARLAARPGRGSGAAGAGRRRRRRRRWSRRRAQTPSDQRLALMRLESLLRDRLGGIKPHERTAEQQAVALVASSVLFHAREDKPVWQAHFERLRTPVGDWRSADGVFLVESGEVVEDWHSRTPRQRPRRTLRLRRRADARHPGRPRRRGERRLRRPAAARRHDAARPLQRPLLGHGRDRSRPTTGSPRTAGCTRACSSRSSSPRTAAATTTCPSPSCPSKVLSTRPIDDALAEVAQQVVDGGDDLPRTAGIDLLAPAPAAAAHAAARSRRGRRARPGTSTPSTAALLGTDDSYLAVQGPPGTGQDLRRLPRHRPARARARLARSASPRRGTRRSRTSCGPSSPPASRPSRSARRPATPTDATLDLAAPRPTTSPSSPPGTRVRAVGYVVGGTAWDLTNTKRVGRGQLDLVVVDEAGQFSLAKTLACSVAGARLLLLGDPQQLPQVSQGTHPDPVDASALGWLIGDEPVLPAELGYFLETTWRMHPALTAPVSRLSYAGQLRSEETRHRRSARLDGVEPGLHVRLVDHHDNSTWSPEEAEVVLDLVHDLLGRTWHDPSERGRRRRARSVRDRSRQPTSSSSRPTTARSASCAAPSTTPA